MRFKKFFSIEISHDYFETGKCADLLIQPTDECKKLLKNHKLLFNNSEPNSVSVLAGINEQEKLLNEPLRNSSFDFYLYLLNPDFVSYSKLAQKKTGEVYFFSSKNVDSKNKTQLVSSTISRAAKTVDGKPLFGLVQIFFTGTFPATYTLHFEASESKWKYYVVVNSNFKNVTVNGALAGLKFSKNNGTDKNQTDEITEAINNNFPDADLVVFESDVAIPYKKTGRKNIQLINSDKNNVLFNHLPNPSYNDNGIKIINITK